ncbi:glycerophosphoryl diester phosphodiesterase membrane domain-containing protein [Cryobacterium fucosi]|uniref:Glycerophosphoryl diester phosphodiesterase membrane domain-containing protein n=1 Tax=Cryobacterium fucosi TaxID=1259157 RepID=A0A4R9B766_9MICO|nr:glycerophosphoryl diester phosphodiesterase membrane domain-containing protein [Cryobacterium fucosi]TFD77354.1 hypothetical protein E3T48_08965 [Cryobacterium fucosi]
MTDPQNWQSPTNDGQNRPRYGEQVPPPARPGGDRQPGWGAPSGWAPPPRPGLIPLRPLGFGTLLWAPYQVLRRNPKATFGSALLIQAVVTLVTLVVVGSVTYFALSRVDSAPLAERDAVQAGSWVGIALSALIPIALSLVAGALLQGVIVLEVARATLGDKLRLGQLWRMVGRRLWPLVLWTLLLSAVAIVALGLVAGAVVLFVTLGGAWVALAVILGILGVLLFIAGAAWLGTRLSLVPCLIVLERLGIRRSVRRSWSLTTGYFWRTLGVQMLVAVIINVVSQVVVTPVSVLFSVATSLVDPNASFDAYLPSIVLYVLVLFVSLVLGAVATVVQSATVALIYIDLRMRKEGLDLELARFVESAPGSGATDPYLVGAARTEAPRA